MNYLLNRKIICKNSRKNCWRIGKSIIFAFASLIKNSRIELQNDESYNTRLPQTIGFFYILYKDINQYRRNFIT
jgi:hypothetical protein